MIKGIKNILKKLYYNRNVNNRRKLEWKNIKKKEKLVNKVTLSKEQENAIDDLWIENYGKKIPYDWHRLYTSYTGQFDERYFPEILFSSNLINKLNSPKRKIYLDDKILMTYFFKDIKNEKYKLAKNYIYNCNGYFYDDNRNTKL